MTSPDQETTEDGFASEINFDKTFIRALLDKLKVGNRRGIHLNAIPGRRATRLDLHKLEILGTEKIEEFIQKLLSEEEFSFTIDFSSIDMNEVTEEEKDELLLLARRLDSITYEVESQYLEFGLDNFGIGYPLLIRRDTADPAKIIKAPLLIWSLEIKKSNRKSNEWTISRKQDSPIVLNELLKTHVLKDAQVEVDSLDEEFLEDGVIDKEELSRICSRILNQLNIGDSNNIKPEQVIVTKCPATGKTIDGLATDNAWFQWSAIFGIYVTRKETIIQRTEELLAKADELKENPLIVEKFRTSTVSSVETDPSKEELVKTLTDNEFKLIQGPPGTGKSQALTAIITNVLENDGRCLVVCEKKTALDIIYQNMERIGLEDLCVVIDDVNRDRSRIVKSARDRVNAVSFLPNTKEFKEKNRKYKKLQEEIVEKHGAISESVFGEKNWKDLVGMYLRYARSVDFSDLKTGVDASWIENTPEEYDVCLTELEKAQELFARLTPDMQATSTLFDQGVFKEPFSIKLRDQLERVASESLETVVNLRNHVQEKSVEDLSFEGVNILEEKKLDFAIDQSEKTLLLSNEALDIYSQVQFDTSEKDFRSPLKMKLQSFFDKELKEFLDQRSQLQLKIKEINKSISHSNEIDDKSISIQSDTLLHDCIKNIETLSQKKKKDLKELKRIDKFRRSLIKKEKLLLSKVQYPLIKITDLLFTETSEWTKYVDSVLDLSKKIESLNSIIREYEHLHNWNAFENSADENVRKITDVLKEAEDVSWIDIFSAWYFYHVMTSNEKDKSIGIDEGTLERYTKLHEELKQDQPKIIRSKWQQRAGQNKREFERKNNANFNLIYNLRKNSKFDRTNSLRTLLEKDFDLFTSIFPIVLINPNAANAILPLEQGLFDVVLFDEASQLRIEDTFTSMIRGKYKIIAGDKHQMPPSDFFSSASQISLDMTEEMVDETEQQEKEINVELALSESLLEYANNLKNKNESFLDYHYRSKHPALINFSNQAFYGGNLVPFPEKDPYNPIELVNVEGSFIDGVNKEEAEVVLKILKEVSPNEYGVYPSVGVATFNIHQRNYINDEINLKSVLDSDFAEKVDGLRQSGLFVKNLENIQGDERDIIILSTTYGKGEDGRFFERFGQINLEKGYKLLNVIITRAKLKMNVVTSVPSDRYQNYAEHIQQYGNNRKAMFYAYLAYADALTRGDASQVQSVLDKLKQNTLDLPRNKQSNLVESPFEQEVYEMLREEFREDQIHLQYEVGGFRIDFVVIREDGFKIAIECDGKAYHSSNEAYAYDSYRQKELEQMGFKVLRIWSTKWWHDHEREFTKLVEGIKNIT